MTHHPRPEQRHASRGHRNQTPSADLVREGWDLKHAGPGPAAGAPHRPGRTGGQRCRSGWGVGSVGRRSCLSFRHGQPGRRRDATPATPAPARCFTLAPPPPAPTRRAPLARLGRCRGVGPARKAQPGRGRIAHRRASAASTSSDTPPPRAAGVRADWDGRHSPGAASTASTSSDTISGCRLCTSTSAPAAALA